MGKQIPGAVDIDLLQILRNDSGALRVRFFTNEVGPEDDLNPEDLEPAAFDGNDPTEIANPGWQLPDELTDGIGEIVSNMCSVALAADMDPVTIYGCYAVLIVDNVEYVAAAEVFDQPITLTDEGDAIERAFKCDLTEFVLE